MTDLKKKSKGAVKSSKINIELSFTMVEIQDKFSLILLG